MIYVDQPKHARKGVKKPRKLYAHMIADSLEELHQFAKELNIKKHFFHNHKNCPHYDINSEQHKESMLHNVKQVTTRELLKIGKVLTDLT